MKNKTISISEEVFDLLAEEKNASALINQIVIDYYDSIKKPKKTKEEIILDPIGILEKSAQEQKWKEESEMLEEIKKNYQEQEKQRLMEIAEADAILNNG